MKRQRPSDLHSDESTTPSPPSYYASFVPAVLRDMWRSLTQQWIVAVDTLPPSEFGNSAKRRAIVREGVHSMPGHFPSTSPESEEAPRWRWPTTPSPSPPSRAAAKSTQQTQSQTYATPRWVNRIYSWLYQTPDASAHEQATIATSHATTSDTSGAPPDLPANDHPVQQSRRPARQYLSIRERLARIEAAEQAGRKVSDELRQNYPATHTNETTHNREALPTRDTTPIHTTPTRELTPRKTSTPRTSLYGRKSLGQSRSSGLRQSVRDEDVDGLLARFRRVTHESAEERREAFKLRKRRIENDKGPAVRAQEREEAEQRAREEEIALEEQKAQEQLQAQREEEQRLQEEQRALEALLVAQAAEIEKARKNRLVRPLDPKWATIVKDAMSNTNPQKVFSRGPSGTEITRYVLGKILPQTDESKMGKGMSAKRGPAGWLNDECVDNWIAMVVARKLEQDGYVKGPANTPSFAAYLAAFWTNYKDENKGISSIKGWSRRKGISGTKLLGVDKIFFPVNYGNHWVLLVIQPKNRVIEAFDSNGGSVAGLFRFAREWLAMELGEDYNASEWQQSSARSSLQQNCDDCGVFTCINALASAKDKAPTDVQSTNGMRDARNMMVAVLINGGFKDDWEL